MLLASGRESHNFSHSGQAAPSREAQHHLGVLVEPESGSSYYQGEQKSSTYKPPEMSGQKTSSARLPGERWQGRTILEAYNDCDD